VITDGQPTAYFLNKRLYCEWPLSLGGISMRAAQETLKEVERITRKTSRSTLSCSTIRRACVLLSTR